MKKIWIASVAAFSLLFHPFVLTMELTASSSNSNNNNTSSSRQNQELPARELARLHARIIMESAASSSNSNSNNNNNTSSSRQNQELPAQELARLHARIIMESAASNSNSNSNNNNNTSSSSKNQELLARELAQLHAQIIKATNAEEDVAFKTRLELKRQLESLQDKDLKAGLLSDITQWWAELPPPQNLVREQITKDDRGIDELRGLFFSHKLTPDHPRFLAIIDLLKKIAIFKSNSNPFFNRSISLHDHGALNYIGQQLDMLERYYGDFIKNFCTAGPIDRNDMLELQIRMSSERLGHYLIPLENALKLLSRTTYDRSTREENPQQGGQSAVVPLGGVHFKAGNSALSDINPAMEWAMHAFATLLRGKTIEAITAPSAFLSLQKLDDRVFDVEKFATDEEAKKAKLAFGKACTFPEPSKRITPAQFFFKNPTYDSYFKKVVRNGTVQASLTSGNEDLVQILTGNNNNNNIDPVSFGTLVIQSLVTVPTDAKDDNIRVVTKPENCLISIDEDNRLISIDNDRALGDMIVQASNNKHYIQGKNVLYLLPLMKEPVHKTIRNRIKEINAINLIKEWLNLLKEQNGHYNELFKNECLDKETYTKYFPLRINPGISGVMLKRLLSIQNMLEKPDPISYQQLLSELFPLAGVYYEKLRLYFSINSHYAQHAILYQQEQIKGLEDNSIEAFIEEELNNNNTLLRQLSLEKSKAGDYEDKQKRSQSIEAELKFFSDQERAENLYNLGFKNYFGVQRNYLQAYQLFKEVIKINPNHADALLRLGEMHLFGHEVQENYQEAYQLFNQVITIDPNHAKALYKLGAMNYFGQGISEDYSKAYQLFNQVIAIDQKNIEALFRLGTMNCLGHGVPQNYPEAYRLFNQVIAIDPNHANALSNLNTMNYTGPETSQDADALYYRGLRNYFGLKIPQDYPEAYRLFEAVISTNPNHVKALYHLGFMNYFGQGISKDYPKACQFFNKVVLIDPNHAKALYHLGFMNYFGWGIPKDYPEAYRFSSQLIKLNPNHAEVLYRLGEMNYFGWGIPKDYPEAYRFFNRLIELNPKHVEALYKLGFMNYFGWGTSPNLSMAYQLFDKLIALNPNHANALFCLGRMNYFGWGTSPNLSKAYQLFNQLIAIDPNHANALYYLGVMNYFGWGTPENNLLAYQLFNKVIAIKQNHTKALYYLDELKNMGIK